MIQGEEKFEKRFQRHLVDGQHTIARNSYCEETQMAPHVFLFCFLANNLSEITLFYIWLLSFRGQYIQYLDTKIMACQSRYNTRI